jgi:hypothetical protein
LWDLSEYNILLIIPPINPNEAATSLVVGEDGNNILLYNL